MEIYFVPGSLLVMFPFFFKCLVFCCDLINPLSLLLFMHGLHIGKDSQPGQRSGAFQFFSGDLFLQAYIYNFPVKVICQLIFQEILISSSLLSLCAVLQVLWNCSKLLFSVPLRHSKFSEWFFARPLGQQNPVPQAAPQKSRMLIQKGRRRERGASQGRGEHKVSW